MLLSLLTAIKSYPLADIEKLGRELNVSTQLIEEMVLELTRKGYLRSFEDCDSTCDHCPVGSACSGNVHPKVWMLTEKGLKTTHRTPKII